MFNIENISRVEKKIIFHIDFDYFFAQCEEIRNPSIKDMPVVVCVFSGRTKESGVVSTANYVARKYGIKSGIPIRFANSKLKDFDKNNNNNINSFFLPIDIEYYKIISNRAIKIIKSVTTAENYEIIGIDECYLDLTNIVNNNYKKAIILANVIKNRLYRELNLSCSIGISYNKLLAKIASEYKKPNGLFVIEPNETLKIISDLDISIIPGIGPKNKRKLNKLGITTFKQLSEIDITFLKKNFGNYYAEFLHNSSLGINKDPINIKQQSKQITRIKTLKEYTNDIEYVKSLIAELCKSIYTDLIKRELLFKSIGLIFIDNKLVIVNRSKNLKNYTQNLNDLIENAYSIFLDYLSTYDIFKLRRIGVKVSEIKRNEGRQNTLFNYIESS
jgi:DNA polymerase IV (archaeal DinB-like DNA polymerase)